MDRAERRQRTDRVARRRFREVKAQESRLSDFYESDEVVKMWRKEMRPGHLRKHCPFTFPKVPKRQWFKLLKERHARFKDDRRNGDDGAIGELVNTADCDPAIGSVRFRHGTPN